MRLQLYIPFLKRQRGDLNMSHLFGTFVQFFNFPLQGEKVDTVISIVLQAIMRSEADKTKNRQGSRKENDTQDRCYCCHFSRFLAIKK